MGRTDHLHLYYWKSRVEKYVKHWNSLLERHTEAKFCYALSEFYVDVTRTWQQEVQWCSLIFDQPAILSCRVLVELSKSLEDKFCDILDSKVNPNAENVLQLIIEFKDACDDFTDSVKTSGYLPSHSELPDQLFKLVYQPLVTIFDKFQIVLEKEFRKVLDSTMVDHVELGECVQLLSKSEERIFDHAATIRHHSERLLDGFIAPVFIPMFDVSHLPWVCFCSSSFV